MPILYSLVGLHYSTERVDRNSRALVHIMDLFIIAHFAGIGGSTQVEDGCPVIT